ncbi:DNA-binding transcriptional ArsR family regulator [Caulobacter ginsengisoli]|uniref:DNA-binding transcriptional ArsR family regulator n=1 Tax=Caulobacter ginsengisoli TaxID=400775 RepID=A0ABU0IWK2_9CAUL|nr:metalloregulator ArsR/SmtB family transcription factor [Caulobacter ginsengisoli]MDQ0466390.1 DNA-binding transcriptional ArsR family regulator [Caulobacter ginsengisoli]
MVQEPLDHVFHALSHPARRAMLATLTLGERNIGELAAPHAMSFAAASKHVRVLEGAGLVARRVEGRNHVCALQAEPLSKAEAWLSFFEGFWNRKLDALKAVLKARKETP